MCVWTLSLTTRNDTHAPITHPLSGRIFCLPRCLITLFRGLITETFRVDSRCPECMLRGLLNIFVGASGPTTPYDVTCRSSFDAIYSKGLDASCWVGGDILGRHVPQESLSDRIAKFPLFFLRAALTTQFTARCFITPTQYISYFIVFSDLTYLLHGAESFLRS